MLFYSACSRRKYPNPTSLALPTREVTRLKEHTVRRYIILFTVCLALAPQLLAQGLAGHAHLWYDDSTGDMLGYCETDLDGDAPLYYQAGVVCEVKDDNNNEVALKGASDLDGFGWVDVEVEFAAEADTEYTIQGDHSAMLLTHPAGLTENWWDDYYFFQWFQGLSPQVPDFYYPGPGPETPANGVREVQVSPSKDDQSAPIPTVLSAQSWCIGYGASVEYWLIAAGGGREKHTWDVVEFLTPKNSSPPAVTSKYDTSTARTSYQTGNGFIDGIGGTDTFDFTQSFQIFRPDGAKPGHPVSIDWFHTMISSHHITMNGGLVRIDGVLSPASCRYR